jgi:hypothetical protein
MAPLILTTDGEYVVAAQVESFVKYEGDEGIEDLYVRTKQGNEHRVINNTSPAKEANLFRQIGFTLVYGEAPVQPADIAYQ